MTPDLASDRGAQKRADEIFNALDTYGRMCLATTGTAFTTYEEEGEDVCEWLNQTANAWRCSVAMSGLSPAEYDKKNPRGGRS